MAVQDPTTNFKWELPDVAGDSGAWGALLNSIFGEDSDAGALEFGIDKVVNDIKTTADNAIQKDGSISMTGELDILTERYTAINSADTGTVTLDLDAGNFFHIAPSGAVTIAFSNVPASPDAVFIQIEFTNAVSQTITFPASVKWPGGTVPTFTAGVDLITGFTRDGGVTWRLAAAMLNSS